MAVISVVLIIWLVLSFLLPYLFLPPIPRQEPYDFVPDWGTGVTVGSDEDTFLENITIDNVDLNVTWDLDPSLTIAIITPADPPRYWRNIIYDTYTGHNWQKSNSSTQLLSPVNPGSEIVYTIQQNISHGVTGNFPLLHLWPDPMIIANSIQCPNLPYPDSYDLLTDEYDSAILAGRFSQSDNTTLQYQVTYNPLNWTTIRPLAQSASLTPAPIRAQYQQQGLNQLSAATRAAIQANLTLILAGVPDNAFEEAFAILNYFKANFAFNLFAPRPGSSDEAVEFFLNQGEGVGLDFATAYTMFLRESGIAARPVFGVILGEDQGTQRVLHLMHAHFWVEVYVPTSASQGYWLQFDPTPLPSYITDGSPPPTPVKQEAASSPVTPDQDPYVISTYYNLTIQVSVPFVDRFVSFQVMATLTKDGAPEPGETLYFYDDTENWLMGTDVTSGTGDASKTFDYNNSAIVGWHLLRVAFHARSEYSFIALRGAASLTFSATPLEVNRTQLVQFSGKLSDAVNSRGISYMETLGTSVNILLNSGLITQVPTDGNGDYSTLSPIPSTYSPLGQNLANASFELVGIINQVFSSSEWLNITATSQLSVQAMPNAVRVNSNVTIGGTLQFENGTGIAGQPIQILWDSTPIGVAYTDSTGNYFLNYTPTVVGQFPIEVRFASGNNIYGSIAYTSARVHDQGTIFVYVEDDDGDDITQRGLTVRFSGRVENQTGDPQSGVPVIIFLDSYQIPVQNTTLADGSFIIYYQLESSLSIGLLAVTGDVISGTLQVVSTIDYLTINSTTDIQNLEFNATRVMIGETIILTGLIIDDNATGVVGESLDIFLSYQSNTTLVGSVISLLDGNFSFTFTIPGSIPATDPTVQFEVRFSGTPYLGLSNNSRTLDVFTNATLLIEVDSRVYYWFDEIPVDGTLIDNFGRPLANRPIQININGTNRYSAYSDTQGSVSFSLNFAPPQTTNYSIQLLHETITTVYSPIRTITVEVQQPMQIIPPWHIIIPIIIIVVVIIVGVVLYRYWKRRPRRPSTPSVDASAMLTTLRGLLTDKKYQETLIYAFRMFETIVQAKLGLFRDPSITLREFGNLAVAHGQLNTRTMEVFIRGVEEARFSDHPISYNSALMSLNAFASIYNSLTGGNLRFVTQEQQPEQSEGQSD